MPGTRLARIMAELEVGGVAGAQARKLCVGCAEIMAMSGSGIMLMSGEVARGSVCSSNRVSALIEDLQFTLGEGPCVDAYHQDQPVFEPDLADATVWRWPAFTPQALAAGVRAVFGFPMRVGSIRLGALNLYRDRPGPLEREQHSDGLVLAGVAARAVLDMQAAALPGTLGAELEAGADFRFVVHQASGMVSVQLDVTVGEALVRLRSYAFAHARPLTEVSQDVVARRLRLR